MFGEEFYLLDILIVIFVFWVLFFTYYTMYWFGSKFSYMNNKNFNQIPIYQGFIRDDQKDWNPFEFLLVGIFLLPIRIFLIIITLLIPYFPLKFLSIFFLRENQPQNRVFKFISSLTIRIIIRLLLFYFGFYWISDNEIIFDEKKYPKLKKDGKIGEEKIIISNHINPFDAMILVWKGNRTLIAKQFLKSIPIVGLYSQIMEVIFVDRFNSESRQNTLDTIKQRLNQDQNNFRPIIIFPEGTVNNGKSLLNFKKGAFIHQLPLRITGFKYNGTIKPLMSLMTQKTFIIACLCNFYNSVNFYECKDLINLKDQSDNNIDKLWEIYAKEIQLFLSKELQLKIAGGDLKLLMEFEQMIGFKNHQQQKQDIIVDNKQITIKIFFNKNFQKFN